MITIIKPLILSVHNKLLITTYHTHMVIKMQPFLPTFVLRHRKENLKKCSLRGLESREDFCFATYPILTIPDLKGYVILDLEAPLLSEADQGAGLFIIDATWRYAGQMVKFLEPFTQGIPKRSLPSRFRTAYPRKQQDCPNPECGLASIEAIYAAYQILGRDVTGLLDHYHWKDLFLQKNGLV